MSELSERPESQPATKSCPSCGADYMASVDTCPDCEVELLAPLADGPPEGEGVAYELDDWDDQQRATLERLLRAEGVGARFEGTEVVVAESDADVVEELIDDIDHPDALDAEDVEVDDEASASVLSSLYVTSDILMGDPKHSQAVVELLEAVETAATVSVPYGLEGGAWADIRRAADGLGDLLGAGAEEEEVREAAKSLRGLVRDLV